MLFCQEPIETEKNGGSFTSVAGKGGSEGDVKVHKYLRMAYGRLLFMRLFLIGTWTWLRREHGIH